jgi:hypothetical protein
MPTRESERRSRTDTEDRRRRYSRGSGERTPGHPVVGATSGGMAARISPLAVDRCLGNELNRTAHGELDINC